MKFFKIALIPVRRFKALCRTKKFSFSCCTKQFIILVVALLWIFYSIRQLNHSHVEPRLRKGHRDHTFATYHLGDHVESDVTVVAMYFKLRKSKHSNYHYSRWQNNFFNSITEAPLVIYTDRQSFPYLARKIVQTNNPKTIYVCNDIWSITRLIEMDRHRNYTGLYQTRQYDIDPENWQHSPHLYAVWNAKPFIMQRSSSDKHNVYNSKFFIYTDIGAFRRRVYPEWPDTQSVMRLGKRLKDRMLFGRIADRLKQPGNFTSDFTQGTFFVGSSKALISYYKKFYDIHDELLDQDQFVGKDQTIMNYFSLLKYPQLSCHLNLVKLHDECFPSRDIWFLYQYYFSHRNRYPSYIFLKKIYSFLNLSELHSFKRKSIYLYSQKFCQSLGRYYSLDDVIECDQQQEFIGEPVCNFCSRL